MDVMNSTSRFLMRAYCVGYIDKQEFSENGMRDVETTDMCRHAYIYLTDCYITTLRDFR
jgi:hypothetical protein